MLKRLKLGRVGTTEIPINGLDVPLVLRRSRRARRFSLQVSEARRSAVLTVPSYSSLADAEQFLSRHMDWLKKRLDGLCDPVPFADGAVIPLRGLAHRLNFVGPVRRRGVVWIEDSDEARIAPVWPDGITGSISHCKTGCVAAVGVRRLWAGIGVDLEEATPLDPMLVEQVCSRAERRWLGLQPGHERGLLAKLIFSAKEATYKAQYPTTGCLFGFDVIEITVDRAESGFEACFQSDQGAFAAGTIFAGSYAYAAGLLVTGVAVGQSIVAGLGSE